MTSHVEFAHYDEQNNQVQIRYVVNHVGMVQNKRTDYLDTEPKGNWKSISFTPSDSVTYSEFLNTMVHQSVDVARKMNIVELERILEKDTCDAILQCELMATMCILDPTFKPPIINISCRWQRDMVYDIVSTHFRVVILTCRNITNLIQLFKILRTL